MAIDRPKKIRDELVNNLGYSNVFHGDLSYVEPDKAVSVRDSTGPEQIDLVDGSDKALNRDGIRIVVRGDEDDILEARGRARDIMQDLHKNNNISGFVSLVKRGGIRPMPRDEDGRPRFVIEFIVYIKE